MKKINDVDVLALFHGLSHDQAERLADRITQTLPTLREEIIAEVNPNQGNLSDGSNGEPKDDNKMELSPEQIQAIQEEIDRQVAEQVGRVSNEIAQDGEASRLSELDQQEKDELATLPKGVAGLRQRSNVNAKYQALKHGAKTDGSLLWLNAEREKNQLSVPETDDQYELMRAYRAAIAPWRGNVRRISTIQAAYRKAGLNI